MLGHGKCRMWSTVIIPIVCGGGVLLILIQAVMTLANVFSMPAPADHVIGPILWLILGPIGWIVLCALFMAIFAIEEMLHTSLHTESARPPVDSGSHLLKTVETAKT